MDLYVASQKIAFEYQGIQHYIPGPFEKFMPLQTVQYRDEIKREACKELGITLIFIPYWWDLNMSSLEATIYKYCPHVFSTPPKGIFSILL